MQNEGSARQNGRWLIASDRKSPAVVFVLTTSNTYLPSWYCRPLHTLGQLSQFLIKKCKTKPFYLEIMRNNRDINSYNLLEAYKSQFVAFLPRSPKQSITIFLAFSSLSEWYQKNSIASWHHIVFVPSDNRSMWWGFIVPPWKRNISIELFLLDTIFWLSVL